MLLVTLGAGVVAVVRLRDRAHGWRFGAILIAIGVGVFVQHGLGSAAADGEDVDGFRLEVGGADEDSGAVDLPAGDYVIYCDVPGHRDAGMEAELQAE